MMRLGRYVFACVLLCAASVACSSVKSYQLSINRGTYVTVKQTSFPAIALNVTQEFSLANAVIEVAPGDTLSLTIFNNDTSTYGFTAKGLWDLTLVVSPGTSSRLEVPIKTEGIFLYEDAFDRPKSGYLGFGGMIVSTSTAHNKFFWNIKEHNAAWSDSLARGGIVDWSTYDPDFFTINGKSYPDIQNDTTAKISANVGDTVIIFIANTGRSMHSLHFHGFHAKSIFTTDPSIGIGWEKDTWALRRMTGVVLQLVVDKPGLYSVHDHNLSAVSGGGTHPNGMFLIMEMK